MEHSSPWVPQEMDRITSGVLIIQKQDEYTVIRQEI